MRVGCFNGTVNGEFDDPTKAALQRFIKLTSLSVPNDVSPDVINAVGDSTNGYARWCVSTANTRKAKHVSPTNCRQSMRRQGLRQPVSPLLGLGPRLPVNLLLSEPYGRIFSAG